MAYEITTCGGGEILNGVFNAIAMCLNSKTGCLYTPLIRIGMTIGAVWGIGIFAFKDQIRLLSDMMLPMLVINAILFVPSTTVWILDPILKVHHKIDHVPFGVAAFSSHISHISKVMTEQIEKIFTLPDDLKYQKTGTLFASNIIQKSKTFRITNEDIAGNMKEFVCQCVMIDAMLGKKYSIEDLRNSADIWKLISEKPSPIRSILWKDPTSHASSIVTCKEAVQKFNVLFGPLLDKTAERFGKKIFGSSTKINAKSEFLQYLPVSFGYFLKSSKNAQEILKQQMMIHSIVDGVESKSTALGNAPNLAARRAYLQQKMTYDTIGEMVLDFLPVVKGVFEALCYGAFLFLVPLAMMPQGYRFLFNWVSILIWLQMWAPLYAILNYVMNVSLQSKSLSFLSFSNDAGITIASCAGIYQLHSDMASIAGYLSISIPFICIGLVKGVGAFMHMASSITGVAQSSASSMGSETTSGNYSFGNISEGNVQMLNKSAGIVNTQSSYKSGSFQHTSGRIDMMTSADGSQVLNVSTSQIPVAYNVAHASSDQLMEQSSKSYQMAFSKGNSAAQSLTDSYRRMMELSKHQSAHENSGASYGIAEQSGHNQSISKASRMLESFAKNNNLSTDHAAEMVAKASIGGSAFGASAHFAADIKADARKTKAFNEAVDLSKSREFQNAVQESIHYSKNKNFSKSDEVSKRMSDQMVESYEQSSSYRDEASKNYRISQDLQNQASYVQSHSSTINTNFTQQAIEAIANMPADNATGKIGMRTVSFWAANRPDILTKHMERYAQQQGLVQESSSMRHNKTSLEKDYDNYHIELPEKEGSFNKNIADQIKESQKLFLKNSGETIKNDVEIHHAKTRKYTQKMLSPQEKNFRRMKTDVQKQQNKPIVISALEESKNTAKDLGSTASSICQNVKKMLHNNDEKS